MIDQDVPPEAPIRWGPRALLLPLLGATVLAGFLLLSGPRGALLLGFLLSYLVPPLSKETVLPLAVAAGFSPWEVGLYFTLTDLLLAAFVAWNWDLLYRAPKLGPRLAALEGRIRHRAAAWELRRNIALAGVTLFMALPFQGSGAATATLLGRALALWPTHVFLAVAVGAVVLNFGYAFLAGAFLEQLGMAGLAGGALLVAAGFAGIALATRRRPEAERE